MRAALIACAAIAAGGCAAAPQLTPVPAAPPLSSSSPAALPVNIGMPDEARALLPALREDAARRSGVSAAQLQVVSVEDVTWADGALGCAQPRKVYTMALVPGWRIVLTAPSGPPQHYHASRRGNWVWCPRERAQPPARTDPRR